METKAMVSENNSRNAFDTLEMDLRSIKHETSSVVAAAPEPQIVQVPVYYQVPVFMYPYPVAAPQQQQQAPQTQIADSRVAAPFDATTFEAPKTTGYYKTYDGRSSNVKSIEELWMTNDRKSAANRKGSGFMTVDEMINQHASEFDSKAKATRRVSVPASAVPLVAAPAAPVLAPIVPIAPVAPVAPVRPAAREESEEVKFDHNNPFDDIASSISASRRDSESAAASKAKSMAQFFDGRATELKERRDLMPHEGLHDGEMYLMSGMRPVKPVHTNFEQSQ
jgi:hypothetical protein